METFKIFDNFDRQPYDELPLILSPFEEYLAESSQDFQESPQELVKPNEPKKDNATISHKVAKPVKRRAASRHVVHTDGDVYLEILRQSGTKNTVYVPDRKRDDTRLNPPTKVQQDENHSSYVVAAYMFDFPLNLHRYSAFPSWFTASRPRIEPYRNVGIIKHSKVYIIHVTHVLVQVYCSLATFHNYFKDINKHREFFEFALLYLHEVASISQMIRYGRRHMPEMFTEEWAKVFNLRPCVNKACAEMCYNFSSEHNGLRAIWRDHTGFNFSYKQAAGKHITQMYRDHLRDELGNAYELYSSEDFNKWSADIQTCKMHEALSTSTEIIYSSAKRPRRVQKKVTISTAAVVEIGELSLSPRSSSDPDYEGSE